MRREEGVEAGRVEGVNPMYMSRKMGGRRVRNLGGERNE